MKLENYLGLGLLALLFIPTKKEAPIKGTTSRAQIWTTKTGYTLLNFFNSKEVYSTKGFDTRKKAMNYAAKYGVEIFEKLPENIDTSYYYSR